VPEAQEPQPLDRSEFTRIADRFGNDIAVRIVREGGGFDRAMELHVEALETANKILLEQVAELTIKTKPAGAVPVTDKTKTKNPLREMCEKGATSRR